MLKRVVFILAACMLAVSPASSGDGGFFYRYKPGTLPTPNGTETAQLAINFNQHLYEFPAGSPVSIIPSTAGTTGNNTVFEFMGDAPPTLAINQSTGAISGSIAFGRTQLTVRLKDGGAEAVSGTLTLVGTSASPLDLAFLDLDNQEHGVTVHSNIVPITGITGQKAVSATNGTFSVCIDVACSETTDATTIANGQYLRATTVVPDGNQETKAVTLAVENEGAWQWLVTSRELPPLMYTGISAGTLFTCAAAENGRPYCWGKNDWQQLGDLTTATRKMPANNVYLAHSVTDISAGYQHACATGSSGQAWCWGNLYAGKTGRGGSTVSQGSAGPALVFGTASFSKVYAALDNVTDSNHSCGISADYDAYCWGDNGAGKLGLGPSDTTSRSSPVKVHGNTKFKSLALGVNSTCGLDLNGKVWCWGSISGINSKIPVVADNTMTFASIASGGGQICGITSSGDAYCRGPNANGQLGIGTVTATNTFTAVKGGHKFLSLSAGMNFACGVTLSGDAYCWGMNDIGQLGNGVNSLSPNPLPVKAETSVKFAKISAGGRHTCALTSEGVAYCWGSNSYGELGTGLADAIVRQPTRVVDLVE